MDAAYLSDIFDRIPRLVGIYTALHLKLLNEFTKGLKTLSIRLNYHVSRACSAPVVREGKGH